MFFSRRPKNEAKRSARASNPLPPQLGIVLRESWWLAAVVAGIYLVIILASYNASDPGWSHAATQAVVHNKGGNFGAWLADVLLALFGFSAWWWVVFCLAAILWGYRRLEKIQQNHRFATVAISGYLMILLSSSSMEALRLHGLGWALPDKPGGILGFALGSWLFHGLGFIGSTLVLLAGLAIGLSLFIGVSWLELMEKVGGWIEDRAFVLFNFWQTQQDRKIGESAAQAREQRVTVEKKRFGDAPALRIEDPVLEIPPSKAVLREMEQEQKAQEKAKLAAAQPSLFAKDELPPWEDEAAGALNAMQAKQKTINKKTPALINSNSGELPSITLLSPPPPTQEVVSHETIEFTSRLIERKLAEFGVEVKVVAAYPGPVITRYEVEPAVGVKGSQVVNLMKDLARALSLVSIRVVETIPGKTYMGLELPNPKRQIVRLSEILGSQAYHDSPSLLSMAMGKDISGKPVVTDLAKAPHMLVAGTTGSGKSVAMNAIILSFLYKATPEEVRLIMVDPKMLELSIYEGIPHLLAPVVTDMKHAANALNWCVAEMEKRYRLMSAMGVRNLAGFNAKVKEAAKRGEKLTNPFSLTPDSPEPLEPLPLIVVLIDELADLMMVAGKQIEQLIARLAQKARAAGVHLILATQRPSVDVITGLIKANIPTRCAFQVSSKIDSRTILDQMGAESLLGQGDGLFLPPGTGYPQRIHGAFVADEEVHAVVEFLKSQGEPNYIEGILTGQVEGMGGDSAGGGEFGLAGSGGDGESDEMYDKAVAFVIRTRKASISSVQRELRIGYNRAARLIDQMEQAGIVTPMETNGNRTVLAPAREE
ncbi:DNA translocase FtsK [Chitinimonas sp. BJB300]|uniref:DNA translocase FtsK n=1 Tax=Chitinimonas sp. BJB300 TaxID=1559339 RepID=UPI000C0F830D|nr:DNA translocase FtsK [Chitinimonas sp. BJB300]PHV11549.1 cell division protein FtsK [Chitinimonas sp. BJB300]TSJ87257.1 DNA translocase FtsK [Chitinimonas sp. BJB300]